LLGKRSHTDGIRLVKEMGIVVFAGQNHFEGPNRCEQQQ
jgi:hypothetical protein